LKFEVDGECMKKVIFMGTPAYADVILKRLIDDSEIEVALVLTQPDRPVGRKKILTAPPVKMTAQDNGIEVLQPESLKDEEIVKKIEAIGADLITVAAYGQLLPKSVLDIAPCINLHASILPKYRGASPIQQAILNGDEYSGVTAMLMDVGLDTGDMLGFKYIKTSQAPTLDLMMQQLSELAADLTIDVVKEFENLAPIPQLGALSSKCKKIKKQDGLVNFDSALELYRKYCGYFGWPGIFVEGGMKLYGVELLDSSSQNSAGEILAIEDESVVFACKVGSIKVEGLQPASKAKMSAKAYIMGKRLKVGDNLL